MTRTWKLLVIVLALTLAVGAAACGSDSDSSDSGSGSSSTPTELEGTWTLMNIASQGSASSLPNTVDAPTIEFADGEAQVFTGCNSGSGTAEITDTTIDFGPIALTKKSCDEIANQIESYVSQALQGQVDYKIEQGNLVLDGKPISLIYTQE